MALLKSRVYDAISLQANTIWYIIGNFYGMQYGKGILFLKNMYKHLHRNCGFIVL